MAKRKKTRAAGKAALCQAGTPASVPEKKIPALLIFAGAAWTIFILAAWFYAPQFQHTKLSYFIFHFRAFFESLSIDFFASVPRYLQQLAFFSVLAFACHGIGRLALSFIKKEFSFLERFSYSLAIGLLGLSAWMFILSSLRLLYPAASWIFMVLGAAAMFFSLKKQPARLKEPLSFFSGLGIWEKTAVIITAAILFFAAIQAFTPEVFYDSLVYHLGVPNQWIIEHGFTNLPHNIYSNLFMFHGMAYIACLLATYSHALPRLLNAYVFIASVIALSGMALRLFSAKTAVWSALIYCSFVLAASSVTYAGSESFAIFFCTVSLAAAFRAFFSESSNEQSCGKYVFFALSGLFAGCAMASKATCLMFSISMIIMCAIYFRHNIKESASKIAVLTVSASVPVLPWLIKNMLYCGGNPFFPFAASIFGMLDGYNASMLSSFINDTNPQTSFLSLIISPWNILRGNLQSGEMIPPICFIMLPALFYILKKDSKAKLLFSFAFFSWLFWASVSSMPRFFLPAVPAISLLTALILEHIPPLPSKIFKTVCTAQAVFSFALFFAVMSNHGKFLVFFNRVSESGYLSRMNSIYPLPPWKAIDYANKILPENTKIMFLCEPRSFYLRKRYETSSIFNTETLADYAKKAGSPEEMYKNITADKFTHIIFNPGEGLRANTYLQFDDEKTRNNLKGFFSSYLEIEWHENQTLQNSIINTLFILKITDTPSGPVPPNYIEMSLEKADKLKEKQNG